MEKNDSDSDPHIATRADLLAALLPEVGLHGWTQKALDVALEKSQLDAGLVLLAFPNGIADMLAYYSATADQIMLAELPDPNNMKIRERIRHAVILRCQIDARQHAATRQAVAYLSAPLPAPLSAPLSSIARQKLAAQTLFATANHIWHWAGDTATDYNYYSKRLILSGVLAATRLVWLGDTSTDFANSHAFLNRRIEDVMRFEKLKSRWRAKSKTGQGDESVFMQALKNLAQTRYRNTM